MKFNEALKAARIDKIRKIIFVFENTPLQEAKYISVPKTTKYARYDSGNSNTSTQDHLHLFSKNGKELYSINRNGTKHDGSKAKLSSKEIDFLTKQGFNVPDDGLLESISIDSAKNFLEFELLFD